MKKKIAFWKCQWELGSPYCLTYWLRLTAGAEIDCRFDVWPYLMTQTDSRRRDWRTDWLGLPADTETDSRWLTRTARRHPDWPAMTRIACPLPYIWFFFKFLFVEKVRRVRRMRGRVQQYFQKTQKNFYRTFVTLCLIRLIRLTFKYNQKYHNFQLR